MSLDYSKPPAAADAILKLIAKTPSGRTLLEGFLPMIAKGKVRIEAYPSEIATRLRAVVPSDQPIGACFVVDPATVLGCIHLDFGSPLGVLAPFLVHEIAHALDPRVWRGDPSASRAQMLRTEENAFQIQFLFTQELRERDPEFDRFLRSAFPKARILHELLEPEEIDALYTFENERKSA
jgi:hypothetical protein